MLVAEFVAVDYAGDIPVAAVLDYCYFQTLLVYYNPHTAVALAVELHNAVEKAVAQRNAVVVPHTEVAWAVALHTLAVQAVVHHKLVARVAVLHNVVVHSVVLHNWIGPASALRTVAGKWVAEPEIVEKKRQDEHSSAQAELWEMRKG